MSKKTDVEREEERGGHSRVIYKIIACRICRYYWLPDIYILEL